MIETLKEIRNILLKLALDEDLSLEFGTNMFGNLQDEQKYRIYRFYQTPNTDTWDDIAHIIINAEGSMLTIWRAVIQQDPTFPKVGRSTNTKGKIIEDWRKVPSPELVREAIKNAVYNINLN